MSELDRYGPILQALNVMPGTLAFRVKNEASYSPKRGRYIKMKGFVEGVADIVGVKHSYLLGRAFAFEVKAPGKKPTKEQREWLQRFVACGGAAFVIENAQDAVDCWKEI